MLHTRYYLGASQSDTALRGESSAVLDATKSFTENVSQTNPARAELVNQILQMEQAICDSRDCEITEQKHGYLKFVLLNLFDAGNAEIIHGTQVYSNTMVEKESWSDGKLPRHARGGFGGFLYRATDGQIVLKQATWIS